jgi:hypothetical protein
MQSGHWSASVRLKLAKASQRQTYQTSLVSIRMVESINIESFRRYCPSKILLAEKVIPQFRRARRTRNPAGMADDAHQVLLCCWLEHVETSVDPFFEAFDAAKRN